MFSNQIPSESIQSTGSDFRRAAGGIWGQDQPGDQGDHAIRSGRGHAARHMTASYGSFGSSNVFRDLAYGGQELGKFHRVERTADRPLSGSSGIRRIHDKGNEENVFDRVDYQVLGRRFRAAQPGYTRSWFQTPNSYDAQICDGVESVWWWTTAASVRTATSVGAADQRSKIGTFNIAPTWCTLIGPDAVFTVRGVCATGPINYYPSANPFADFAPDLQSETVAQNRRLTNAGVRSDISYVKGMHNMKAGITYEQTFLTENDSLRDRRSRTLPGQSLTDANGNPQLPDVNGDQSRGSPCTTLAAATT